MKIKDLYTTANDGTTKRMSVAIDGGLTNVHIPNMSMSSLLKEAETLKDALQNLEEVQTESEKKEENKLSIFLDLLDNITLEEYELEYFVVQSDKGLVNRSCKSVWPERKSELDIVMYATRSKAEQIWKKYLEVNQSSAASIVKVKDLKESAKQINRSNKKETHDTYDEKTKGKFRNFLEEEV